MAKSSAARQQVRKQKGQAAGDALLRRFFDAYRALQYETAYEMGKRQLASSQHQTRFLAAFGKCCFYVGQFDEAVATYNQLLKLEPKNVDALHHLGQMVRMAGHDNQAAALFHTALQHDPLYYRSMIELENLYAKHKAWDKLLAILWLHVKHYPEHTFSWQHLSSLRSSVNLHRALPELAELTERQLRKGDVGAYDIAFVGFDLVIKRHEAFGRCVQCLWDHGIENLHTHYNLKDLLAATDDPLFLTLLRFCIVPHCLFEYTARAIRCALSEQLVAHGIPADAHLSRALALSAALAHYFFQTEYLPDVSEAETLRQDRLLTEAKTILAGEHPLSATDALILSQVICYQPIDAMAGAAELSTRLTAELPESFHALIRVTCDDLQRERELATQIHSFSDTCDATSLAVREQYEQNPYPRWKNINPDIPTYGTPAYLVQLLFPQSQTLDITIPERFDLLIAGCGTGQQTVLSCIKYPKAHMTNIDLSRRSLAYATMKAKEAGYQSRCTFMQGDILEIAALGRQFDVIKCSGVLHHMADPMAGWQVLYDILRPGGLMNIGLYSKRARQDIITAREDIARQGLGESLEDMRAFRREKLGKQTFAFSTCVDFYSTSACRDLLFHRQEQQFTLEQIERAIERLGLVFLGFEAPHAILERYYERFPQDRRVQQLAHWDILEQEDSSLFAGMYQFWCYKPA